MNKRLMMLLMGISFVAILGVSMAQVPRVAAQAPTPTVLPSMVNPVDDPGRAIPLDNLPHIMPAHSTTWYTFYYSGTEIEPKPQFVLRLMNGVLTLVRFEVWAKDRMLTPWWQNKPVGQGTQEYLVACAPPDAPPITLTPFNVPHCPTNDLTWVGSFIRWDTYYVRVVNDNDTAKEFLLLLNQENK
jgi:hypothetical protein